MIPYLVPDMPTTEQLVPYLKEVDRNRWYSNFGPLYLQFKQRMAEECLNGLDKDRICLVSSGTSAIELALRSLGLPEKSKVLTTCFTFPATVQAIIDANLTPVLADIDNSNWLLTPSIARRSLKLHDIKAVVPVAAFGMPVDAESWELFTEQTGLPVVVDAAAAILNQDISTNIHYAFSLHATKPVGAGEGGVIVSPDGQRSERIKRMSNFGFEADRSIHTYGTNAKISEYHCAVGLAQLDRLEYIKTNRAALLSAYIDLFKRYKIPATFQQNINHFTPASLYVVFDHTDIGSLFEQLLKHKVETRRLYWPMIQDFPAFRHTTLKSGLNFKNAQFIAKNGLALPFHTLMSIKDVEQTANMLTRQLFKRVRLD